MRFRCSTCGEQHELEGFAWHFAEPLPWLTASESEREHSVLSPDQCELVTHSGRRLFIHACLQIPIKGSEHVFTWGVWCSLSEKSYGEMSENWDNPQRAELGPYFGWLCNQIPEYPETLHLKTHVHQRGVGSKPTVELEATDYPLAVDQREGIDPQRLQQIVQKLLHSQPRWGQSF